MITTLSGEPGHNIEVDDMLLAKRIVHVLNTHYPEHLWMVHVNSEGGVVIIKNYRISFSYGMVLHIKNVYMDPSLKRVVSMAGELLERANMKRGKATGEFANRIEGVKLKDQPKQGLII